MFGDRAKMNWDTQFAARTAQMKRSTVREILKLTSQPDMISFAGGLPAPELFPVEKIQQASDTVLQERGREALQYSTTEGMAELRGWIAERMSAGGRLNVSPDNILILSGSQQALDLCARVLLDEGDRVIVENPTYVGMLQAWKPYLPDFTAIPTDENGMIIDALEPVLAANPGAFKLMYSIPSFQNPQGTTMSADRRAHLGRLLAQYSLPMYEDDPYGDLVFEGDKMPTVLELEADARGSREIDGSVMYAGTFSKTLTPGLRVGWVAAALPVIDKLVQVKQATDLHTSTLSQFITYELVREPGLLDEHVATLRRVYRERRDLMLATLEEAFPDGVTWTRPTGGLFLMVTLPEGMDAVDVLKEAVQHKVAFVPGDGFYIGAEGTGANTFRLNYSNARPERIVEGIRRLGGVLKEMMAAKA
jgi:2-aminoadipate transaminase